MMMPCCRFCHLLWWLIFLLDLQATVHAGYSDQCGSFQYYYGEERLQGVPPPGIQAALRKMDVYLETLAERYNVPSISFGVVYNQQLLHYKAIGYTNKHNRTKTPTPHTIYRIGSISKVWTVLMAMILRDKGVISMDTPIAELDPSFAIQNPWGIDMQEKQGKTLPVKQLASQVSGLPREVPCREDCLSVSTTEVFQRWAKQLLIHATDVQASYSNLAYAILGNVLTEHQNYSSFNESIFDLLITPLRLNHTGVYLSQEQEPYAAHGYDQQGHETEYDDLGWTAPAGQVFSSVHDMAILMMQFFAAFPELYKRDTPVRTTSHDRFCPVAPIAP